MARMKKKGESGAAKNYVTRNQALKKLQISLSDFRRLCILKGIHPQQPRNVKKANKGSTAPASFFYSKDIAYLAHEPVLRSLREHKSFAKKLSRAIGRKEWAAAKNLEDAKPQYSLDHIIKQRYPTFDEALGDIDDALCMIALFANLPAKMYNLPDGVVDHCSRLKREWDEYIVRTKTLRKTFLSIKGIYFQATIRGKDITWLVPYPFTQHVPHDVDFRIMSTFLELYTTLLSFILFKLWSDLGESYPPKLDELPSAKSAATAGEGESSKQVNGGQSASGLSKKLVRKTIRSIEQGVAGGSEDAEPAEEDDATGAAPTEDPATEFTAPAGKAGVDVLPIASSSSSESSNNLFKSCTFYLDRSTPLSLLSFLLRSYGSLATRIGWDPILAPNSPFQEDDSRITHVLIDRPDVASSSKREGRRYVQPQWVVDSANRSSLLPEEKYEVGKTLPPHLSPFVEGDLAAADAEMEDEEGEEEEIVIGSDDEDKEEEDLEDLEESRPALQALLASASDPSAAQSQGLLDAAELEAEALGGEEEIEKLRVTWNKAAGIKAPSSATKSKKSANAAALTEEEREADEAKKMARGLLSNRQRKLYDKLSYTKNKAEEEKKKLAGRREEIKKEEKRKARVAK
ncbi:hypothetical protein BCV69DRAFT_261739 [Microstroma glucosiphilum]|uniref:Pescadillo homolog n=1 Tax=Pseudomicrostroma glucosiphilum TaxID=1684307 RepID=A0A316U2X2_9BASI|nr:hypothetical protein BCV69DRAFT_261739 [Pseudomicrostroma glucosiphilum]PWN19530.1 hypothetical protein BCV69DRAFT_261739 [Pseudomicrostroma glucosiphilum]